MNEKTLHQIISDYRDEFADPNNKIPDPDRSYEVDEYMKLLKRLLKWLKPYSDSEVRKMFDKYIQDGGIYFPTVAGQLLKYKPVKENQEGPYIPNYEETLEITKRLERERIEREEAEKNMTDEERERRDEIRERQKAQLAEIFRKHSTPSGRRKVRFDFSDSESDDNTDV